MLREHILVRLFSVPVTEDVRSGNKSSLCSWRLLVLVYGDFICLINGIKTREPIIRTGQSKENLHKTDVDNVHKRKSVNEKMGMSETISQLYGLQNVNLLSWN